MTEAVKHPLHVVFASAEAAPFVKTGGLGDVAGSLPAALEEAGAKVIVMVPKYSTIDDSWLSQMEHVCDFTVPLGWRNEYCGLERLVHDGITYLFIDNERYFKRDYPYGFFDDGERFAFFSKAVTESLQHLPDGFTCDVLHCNDWHTAMAPVFLREFYQGLPLYENVKTVYSIHNIAFQGQFSDFMLGDVLGLSEVEAAARQLRCDDRSINYMLGAINYSDAVTTVSPSYAEEIRTPEFGEGLDGALRRRQNVLSGIVNGIDTQKNDPATDQRIAATYSLGNMSGKAACKAAIQEELGLEVRDDRPLMVMVTRLTRQKGMDLVTYALERILAGGVQVAVLGTGDRDYEDALRWFENMYPGQMAARIQFDPALSQRMYAGADMFLMPSLFEPCGLSQMIAMRYGTLPVVRETGGLRDTVQPYNRYTGEGTGFSFTHFNGEEMGDAVFRAARLFWDDRAAWDALVAQAMSVDFSWKASAQRYLDLYLGLCPDCTLDVPQPAPSKPARKKAAPKSTSEEKPAESATDAKPEVAKKEPVATEAPVVEAATVEAATKPAAVAAAKPAAATATKSASTKTATKSTTKSAPKATSARTSRSTAKASSTRSTSRSTAKTTKSTSSAKPAAKTTTTSAAKTTAKTTTRAATKNTAKPATKPAAKSATQAKATPKTDSPKTGK